MDVQDKVKKIVSEVMGVTIEEITVDTRIPSYYLIDIVEKTGYVTGTALFFKNDISQITVGIVIDEVNRFFTS